MKFSEIFGITASEARMRLDRASFDRELPVSDGALVECRVIPIEPQPGVANWLDHALYAARRRGWLLLVEEWGMYLVEPKQPLALYGVGES